MNSRIPKCIGNTAISDWTLRLYILANDPEIVEKESYPSVMSHL